MVAALKPLASPLQRYLALTSALDLAALRGDGETWGRVLRERESLGLDTAMHPEIAEYRSPWRCQCCGRLGPACEDIEEPTQPLAVIPTMAELVWGGAQ